MSHNESYAYTSKLYYKYDGILLVVILGDCTAEIIPPGCTGSQSHLATEQGGCWTNLNFATENNLPNTLIYLKYCEILLGHSQALLTLEDTGESVHS